MPRMRCFRNKVVIETRCKMNIHDKMIGMCFLMYTFLSRGPTFTILDLTGNNTVTHPT